MQSALQLQASWKHQLLLCLLNSSVLHVLQLVVEHAERLVQEALPAQTETVTPEAAIELLKAAFGSVGVLPASLENLLAACEKAASPGGLVSSGLLAAIAVKAQVSNIASENTNIRHESRLPRAEHRHVPEIDELVSLGPPRGLGHGKTGPFCWCDH